MISAHLHPQEAQRLKALQHYEVLDTEAEEAFDDLTLLASQICDTPISLVSLVDVERQWFKSRHGLDATQTERSIAFCSHAILQDGVFEIPDASQDERFADNPLVTGAPDIRFYAGAPLVTPDGCPIGTLCVIDQIPHHLTAEQRSALRTLSKQVVSQLELRIRNRHLERMHKEQERIFSLVAHDLRTPFNSILGLSKTLANRTENLSPQRIAQSAHNILSSSLSAYHLLEELLQWSQAQINSPNNKADILDVSPLIHENIAFANDIFRLKELKLHLDIPASAQVLASAPMVKAIVRNLLSNAAKYCPTGGNIWISATAVPNAHHQTIISVANNGDEIAPELRKNLFKQAVASRPNAQGEQGAGIGLMLCSQYIFEHGGDIWIDEAFNDGTKICFSLPASKLHCSNPLT